MPEQTVQHRRAVSLMWRIIRHVQAFPADFILGLIGTAALIAAVTVEPLLISSACFAAAAGCGGLMVIRNS